MLEAGKRIKEVGQSLAKLREDTAKGRLGTYTLTFEAKLPIPSEGTLVLTFPKEIRLADSNIAKILISET